MSTVWLNGSFVDEESAVVSARDTGLLHAAGVFTTMRSLNGRVFRLDRHLARLRESCNALSIPLQYTDEALTAAITDLLSRNSLLEARLRLTVTRGSAIRDAQLSLKLEPTVLITAAEYQPYAPELYERGMTVVLVDEQKLNPYDIQAGHKTLNYFSRLAALRSANQRAAGEALWFNVYNYLQSGSISNVFIVSNGVLITPPTPADLLDPAVAEACSYSHSAVLPGITRAEVIDLATTMGIAVTTKAIDINTLLEADEAFLTNSLMGVMPVCRIERRPIGNDKPGTLTRKLAAALNKTQCEIGLQDSSS